MTGREDWKNLLERGRTLSEVKISSLLEDPKYPDSHWTSWDMVEKTGESNNLVEAAEEIDKPPEPDRRYRLGTVLATGFGTDESIREYEPSDIASMSMIIGGAAGLVAGVNLSGAPTGSGIEGFCIKSWIYPGLYRCRSVYSYQSVFSI